MEYGCCEYDVGAAGRPNSVDVRSVLIADDTYGAKNDDAVDVGTTPPLPASDAGSEPAGTAYDAAPDVVVGCGGGYVGAT